MAAFLAAVAKSSHTSIQWWTLAWVAGAAVAATLIIAAIVLVSRRPKSMEDGMAEFSRSLQAVAPTMRAPVRTTGGELRPAPGKAYEPRAPGRRGGDSG